MKNTYTCSDCETWMTIEVIPNPNEPTPSVPMEQEKAWYCPFCGHAHDFARYNDEDSTQDIPN